MTYQLVFATSGYNKALAYLNYSCGSWPGASFSTVTVPTNDQDPGIITGFRSTAKYPWNRPPQAENKSTGELYSSVIQGWYLGPGRGVANMDKVTKYKFNTGTYTEPETLAYSSGISEAEMFASSPGQKCNKAPCYSLSTGNCNFKNDGNSSITLDLKNIERIFRLDENSKLYGLNGIRTYQVKPGVNKQYWRFLQDDPYGSLTGTNYICQTSRILYKYANAYNPRDIIYHDVFEKYTNYMSSDPDKSYENNFNLVNRFDVNSPDDFFTGMVNLMGTVGAYGNPYSVNVSKLDISSFKTADANRDILRNAAVVNSHTNPIHKIIYESKCYDWRLQYLDMNGNKILGTTVEDVKLQADNRPQAVYSDFFTGTGTNRSYTYFKVQNTTRNTLIGELYSTIDITDVALSSNAPKISTYFSYLDNSADRLTDKIIRSGIDNTPPSSESPYIPPATPNMFVDKKSFFPDTRILWNNQDPREIIKTSWSNFLSLAHDLPDLRTLDMKTLAPQGGFISVGKIPGSTMKCILLFTPNCLKSITCSATADCTWNTLAPICDNGKCVQCNSANSCTGTQICQSGFCGNCTMNLDCPIGQLCQNGVCSNCNSSTQCTGGEVCLNGLCKNCGTTADCPGGQVCDSTTKLCRNCGNTSDCPTGQVCSGGLCTGCSATVSCPTGTGQICKNGLCTNCATSGDCSSGEVCDQSTKLCRKCLNMTDCISTGQVCNTTTGLCSPCSDTLKCPTGMVCNNGVCIPCSATVKCQSGLICNNGSCVNCSAAVPCQEGLVCNNGTCVNCSATNPCPTGKVCTNGTCTDSCSPTSPCPTGKLCLDRLCLNCSSTNLCPTGKVCINGLCENCSPTTPCPDGKVCSSGSCLNCSSTIPCPTGQICSGGSCLNCSSVIPCPDGKMCSGGLCVNCSDTTPCPDGKFCKNGMCVNCNSFNPCPEGIVCKNGSCITCSSTVQCPTGFNCEKSKCVKSSAKSPLGVVVGGGFGILLVLLIIYFLIKLKRRS